jgi:hypothetical protein
MERETMITEYTWTWKRKLFGLRDVKLFNENA